MIENCLIDISYWAWVGTIYLIILTFKDYRNNMMVDDRYNYLMFGLTFSLIFILNRGFLMIIFTLIIILILSYLFKRFKVVGEADINSLTWILYGFAIMNIFKLFWFAVIFISITILHHILKTKFFKIKGKTPFYGVLLISFIVSCWGTGLY